MTTETEDLTKAVIGLTAAITRLHDAILLATMKLTEDIDAEKAETIGEFKKTQAEG